MKKQMYVKFETSSARVKGLAFHPKRPWILVSLHDGVIQLWDYRMEVLIDSFEEHQGPVRSVDFHLHQPIFVSGGDDCKVKVWSYQQRSFLFNLIGHLDYVRTVQFHHEYPWILSASDDQTVIIWNWQNRTKVHQLAGHNHYVMCARFHPRDDMIISASLDTTVRMWDFRELRKKTVAVSASDFTQQRNTRDEDMFVNDDVYVKHLLEGHTRGVNWASFHPTQNLLVSGADDREIKLWKYNDAKVWEENTLRGHVNNVSCVMFQAKRDLILSNSEDKTIRIWDMNKQNQPVVLRRDNDRYWILDVHPRDQWIAGGHDSGMLVFKLNRERPAHCGEAPLYYYKDGFIYENNMKSGKERHEVPLMCVRRRMGNVVNTANGSFVPRKLHYNTYNRAAHCILLVSSVDSAYELFTMNREDSIGREVQAQKGSCKSAVFVSSTRFAVLDNKRSISLKSLKNETKRKITIPNVTVNHIFPGGVGRLLLRTQDAMILYDVHALRIIAEMPVSTRLAIKYVVWSADGKYLALFSKVNMYIATAKLEELTAITENTRIKSAAWDPVGVLIYTTSTHIKYLLPNGDSGVIRTLDSPIYMTSVTSREIHFLDRETKVGVLSINATEYLFKLALMKHRSSDVARIMNSKKLLGQSIISYVQKKGYPEIAMHFVEDISVKFSLALECGNIEVAQQCAVQLNEKQCWYRLGVEALRQGNHQVVENAYQKTKDFERLSFLYLITGNTEKLSKMLHIAKMREDLMGRFHNALYLGDAAERVSVLRDSNQLQLAYLTAATHGLEEEALALAIELGADVPAIPDAATATLLLPPAPVLRENNWPLLNVQRGFDFSQEGVEDIHTLDPEEEKVRAAAAAAAEMEDDDDKDMSWGTTSNKKEAKIAAEQADVGGGGWDMDLGMDLGIDLPADGGASSAPQSSSSDTLLPDSGRVACAQWANSLVPAEVVAAGAFDQAVHLLSRQIGVANFKPLKNLFTAIYQGSSLSVSHHDGLRGHKLAMTRELKGNEAPADAPPAIAIGFEWCVAKMRAAYQDVTDGKFQQALAGFVSILQTLPLIVVNDRSGGSVKEVRDLIGNCREYITALRLEAARKDCPDPSKQAYLAALFTHCKLQPIHLVLGLRLAMKASYQIKNFKMTGTYCRRILELSNNPAVANTPNLINAGQIKGVLAACEKNNADAVDLQYDPTKSFSIDCGGLSILYKGANTTKCPYCESAYESKFDDQVCQTCDLSKVGASATGIVLSK